MNPADPREAALERTALRPLVRPGPGFHLVILVLSGIVAFGFYAWTQQVDRGLGVTGMNIPIFWGVYITNFVFFIGLSHAGTLISSVLRITQSEWRRPFTRMAEAVTVFSLPFGGLSVIVDIGRPDRVANVLLHGNAMSPILWDVACISTYLFTSCVYFYLALIPDLALCRDRLLAPSRLHHRAYSILALGWTGTKAQWRRLDRIMAGLSIFLFMLVISVHTNVSFVFAVTLQAGWHTAIIGPYFVVGAIFQGVAAVIIIAVSLRHAFGLEAYITHDHFRQIGKFLLALSLFWFYFTFVEILVTFYGHEEAHMVVFDAKVFEEFSHLFWAMMVFCFVLPLPFLAVPRLRTIPGLLVASISINIGMWIERFTVIVPSLARPRVHESIGAYTPTWVEGSITAAFVAGFALLYLLFTRLIPVLTVWEIKEGMEHEAPPVAAPRHEGPARVARGVAR